MVNSKRTSSHMYNTGIVVDMEQEPDFKAVPVGFWNRLKSMNADRLIIWPTYLLNPIYPGSKHVCIPIGWIHVCGYLLNPIYRGTKHLCIRIASFAGSLLTAGCRCPCVSLSIIAWLVLVIGIHCPRKIYAYVRTNRPTGKGVKGLLNQGNTCYFNSAMQVVIHTPGLKDLVGQILSDSKHERSKKLKKMEMTETFHKVLTAAEGDGSNLDREAQGLLNLVFKTSAQFQRFHQQDMHQLWRFILNGIKDEELRALIEKGATDEKPLAMDSMFGGHFITVSVCDKCALPCHLCEPFTDVSIPVLYETDEPLKLDSAEREILRQELFRNHPDIQEYCDAMSDMVNSLGVAPAGQDPNLRAGKLRTVEAGLKCLTRKEQLGNGFMCRKCSNEVYAENPEATGEEMTTSATRHMLIFNLPAILTINLKRFQLSTDGRFKKVSHNVGFEETLDLTPYCSKYTMNADGGAEYSLYGVVQHHGSLNGGHYTAYVKVPKTEKQQSENLENQFEIIYKEARLKRVMSYIQAEPIILERLNKRQEMIDRSNTRKELSNPTGDFQNPDDSAAEALKNVNWQWYYISDSYTAPVDFHRVRSAEAFLLFYERL